MHFMYKNFIANGGDTVYIGIEKRKRRMAAAVFLAALALGASLMGGCGGKDTPATTAAVSGQTTTAQASKPETTTGKLIVDADGWPKDKVTALIPKPDFGTVFKAEQPKAGITVISLKELSEKDYKTYVSQLKQAGFDRNAEETTGESILNFRASNEGGAHVELVYSLKNEIAVITVKSGS